MDIGARNAEAVKNGLARSGVTVRAADTGGTRGRTMRVTVGEFTVSVKEAGGEATTLFDADRGAQSKNDPRGAKGADESRAGSPRWSKRPSRDSSPSRPPPPRRGHRLRTVDFSRPTKFTADHQRRIARAIDTFCQTAVTRLSTELRDPGGARDDQHLQLTWSARAVPAPARLAVGDARGPADRHPDAADRRAVVHPDVPGVPAGRLARQAAARAAFQRDRLDASLSRLFESMVHQLSLVWQDLGGVTLLARRDRDLQRRQPDRLGLRADATSW